MCDEVLCIMYMDDFFFYEKVIFIYFVGEDDDIYG